MKNFRLKPEAVPFFKEKHATQIAFYSYWEDIGVDMNALEEVEEAFVTFGHKDSKNTTSLGGWNDENGSFFYFTIKFPSTKFREHDKLASIYNLPQTI
jgi:hypothetical protein|tara:strand:- start:11724 stop:12017 length:294 start_codon:yes stop_codon:yes gene_type:complete